MQLYDARYDHHMIDFHLLVILSCEATLDNTQNVPPSLRPSLPIPVKEFDASSAPRGLKFHTELISWSSKSPTIPWKVTHQPEDGHPPTQGRSMVTHQPNDSHPPEGSVLKT